MGNNLRLQDDGFCFVCGKNNPSGLGLVFNNINGKVVSEFTPSKIYQGYKGITHGGIVSTILDEAMIYAAVEDGIWPVTAEITVRFKKPLITGDTVIVEAEVVKRSSRLITARAQLKRKDDGFLIAEAHAKISKRFV